MKTILLARHATHAEVGRALSGRSEIGLDARGRREAAMLAAMLRSTTLSAIHASPRRRTIETATAIARWHGLPVDAAPALDEVDFGRLTGRSFAELESDADWAAWNAQRGRARCADGETMAEVVARAWTFLTGLQDGVSLCVTHCDVIRGLVCAALGLDYDRMFQLGCDPASVTELIFDGDAVQVMGINGRVPAAAQEAAAE